MKSGNGKVSKTIWWIFSSSVWFWPKRDGTLTFTSRCFSCFCSLPWCNQANTKHYITFAMDSWRCCFCCCCWCTFYHFDLFYSFSFSSLVRNCVGTIDTSNNKMEYHFEGPFGNNVCQENERRWENEEKEKTKQKSRMPNAVLAT